MELLLEVHYLDGRVCTHAWPNLEQIYPGSVHREFDLRIDDIAKDGITVECRHHFPKKTSVDNLDAYDDPRGDACSLVQDAFFSLVDPTEVAEVSHIVRGRRTIAYCDEDSKLFISLIRIQQLLSAYYSPAKIDSFGPVPAIQKCVDAYHDASWATDGPAIANHLGIPKDVLDRALAWEELKRESTSEAADEDEEDFDLPRGY